MNKLWHFALAYGTAFFLLLGTSQFVRAQDAECKTVEQASGDLGQPLRTIIGPDARTILSGVGAPDEVSDTGDVVIFAVPGHPELLFVAGFVAGCFDGGAVVPLETVSKLLQRSSS